MPYQIPLQKSLLLIISLLFVVACNDTAEKTITESQPSPESTKELWTIGVVGGNSPFNLIEPNQVENPVLTAYNVTDYEADIVAHPFVVSKNDRYYLFFTVKNGAKDKGGIGLAESENGIDWQYKKLVIKEPFVLSYPYIFKVEDQYYMIPESHTESALRLYKAVDFPTTWQFEKELLMGQDFISSSITQYNNQFWIFSSDKTNSNLNLFYADDLLGDWQPHPKNPIIAGDANIARPAGRILQQGNDLYRIAQDCEPTYGNKVVAFKITNLTPTTYQEEMIEQPIIQSDSTGWNANAMHHIDFVQQKDGNWLGIVDAFGWVNVRME